MTPAANKPELVILVILRVTGISGLFAIPAIFFPYSWMNPCHELAGLGTLPDTPIVSYLARSLSAFYAILGMIVLYISFDVRHYRALVKLLAILVILFGAVLLWIDLWSGLPALWTWFEGPMTLAMGIVMFWLQPNIGHPSH